MFRPHLFPLIFAIMVARAAASEVMLEDDSTRIAFDAQSGAITHWENKATGWVFERRPELGVSFRLHAPLPDRRDNYVLGAKQKAAEVTQVSPSQVRLRWTNLLSEHGGVLPITLSATVTLDHGALTFAAELKNDSKSVVETVDYPYFGDFTPPSPTASLAVRQNDYDNLNSREIYPHFGNAAGYWGTDFPIQTFGSNFSLFCLVQSEHQGLYCETKDHTQPYFLQWTFEEHPGARDSNSNTVIQSDSIAGTPVHLEFRACHFIFAQPGQSKTLMPIVMRGYSGDWHAGIDLYKAWRATWFKAPHLPAWIQDVNAWMQLQINSPEQNYRIPYSKIVSYADECAANGVAAIQLVGWNHGGQDGGNPSQDTDPGLGTWQELHDAIASSQAEGVKIILFGKFNWADRTTAWDRDELTKYACVDPWGVKYNMGGYSYLTPTQLAGINTHMFEIMDMLSPGYQAVIHREFAKDLALGSEGFLWDEVFHHGGVLYNFAPGHGYEPPGYIYSGDLPTERWMRKAADKKNPDFLFAGESPSDWQRQYFPMAYFRTGSGGTALMRYIDPKEPLMIAVTGFDDREMINVALLNRYIISYEPYCFKGRLTDFPITLAYGKSVDALRRKYKTYLWDGVFRDTLGATVNGGDRYSVFVTSAGKRAVVLANFGSDKPLTASVDLPHPGPLVSASPEHPEAAPCSGTVQVPARSAVVVMEQ